MQPPSGRARRARAHADERNLLEPGLPGAQGSGRPLPEADGVRPTPNRHQREPERRRIQPSEPSVPSGVVPTLVQWHAVRFERRRSAGCFATTPVKPSWPGSARRWRRSAAMSRHAGHREGRRRRPAPTCIRGACSRRSSSRSSCCKAHRLLRSASRPFLLEKRLHSPPFALQVATPRTGGLGRRICLQATPAQRVTAGTGGWHASCLRIGSGTGTDPRTAVGRGAGLRADRVAGSPPDRVA